MERFCPACGAQLADGSNFCGQCGRKMVAPAPPGIPSAATPAGVTGQTGAAPVAPPPLLPPQTAAYAAPPPQPASAGSKWVPYLILAIFLLSIAGYILYSALRESGVIGGSSSAASTSPYAGGLDSGKAPVDLRSGASDGLPADLRWLQGDGSQRWQPRCGSGSPYVIFGPTGYTTQNNYGAYTLVGNVVRLDSHTGEHRVLYITRIDNDHMTVVSSGQSMNMTRCFAS